MGREIRRVKPGWQHPVNEHCIHSGHNPHNGGPCYRPLYDKDYQTAAEEWNRAYAHFMQMTPEERKHEYGECMHFWEWSQPPDEKYYRAERWAEEDVTAYQVYETVSEGTPVSPVFPTLSGLRTWLIGQGHSEYATDKFIQYGWAPSFVMQVGRGVSGIGIDSYDFDDDAPR